MALPGGRGFYAGDIAFSRDDQWLISVALSDMAARVWDLSAAPHVGMPWVLENPHGKLLDGNYALSADGKWLALGFAVGETCLWRLDNKTLDPRSPYILKGYNERDENKPWLRQLVFSADSNWLATRTEFVANLFELNSFVSAPQGLPPVPALVNLPAVPSKDRLIDLAFSDNNRWIATAHSNSMRLWDQASLSSNPAFLMLRVRDQLPFEKVSFSSSIRWLAAEVKEQNKLKKIKYLTYLRDLSGLPQDSAPMLLNSSDKPLSKLTFSSKDRWLATVDISGACNVWNLQLDELSEIAGRVAGRNLTTEEWKSFFPDDPYRRTFTTLPQPRSVDNELAKQATTRAEAAHNAGRREKAVSAYQEAVQRAIDSGDPGLCNSICWQASLRGYAPAVLPAGEEAVKLSPNNGDYRDTRGLARAVIGNLKGAIEDFEAFVEVSKSDGRYETLGRTRERWIIELTAGRSPFDQATLQSLRSD